MRNSPGGRTPLLGTGVFVLLACLTTPIVAEGARAADERTESSEHFTITWSEEQSGFVDPTDADGDGIPDAIETALAAFEEAWAFQVDGLGFQPPPGEGLYRIYAASGAEAHVLPQDPHPSPSDGSDDDPIRSRPSYILFPVGKSGNENAIRRLAAHEFHHAIQAGYDFTEDPWIEEATSTWIANSMVPPGPESLAELQDFVPNSGESLFSTDGLHEYGAFLFLQFLVERFGAGDASIVRELWEQMAVPEVVPGAPDLESRDAIDAVLEARGIETATAWNEFQLWRWRLEKFADGATYLAALEPGSWRRVSSITPIEEESCRLETGPMPALSGEYIRLRPTPDQSAGPARFSVKGFPGTRAFILLKRRGRPVEQHTLAFDDQGVASTIVDFGSGIRAITASLSNGSTSSSGDIGYSLRPDGALSRVAVTDPRGAPRVSYGRGSPFTGMVTCGGEGAPSATVAITETQVVSGESRTFLSETDSTGTWQLRITPPANATYQVQVVDPLLNSATSARTPVLVELFIDMELDRLRVRSGESVHVSGMVRPSHPDIEVLVEYRRPEGIWEPGPSSSTTASGTYAMDLVLPRSGVWEVRARVLSTEDEDHVPGETPEQTIEVED